MDTIPPGVIDRPQGDRPLLDDLGVAELRTINGKLRGDAVDAIVTPTADRWDALALVGWAWHKRTDPRARLEAWTALTAGQLSELLHLADTPDDDGDQADDDDQPWTADPAAELAADPTAPGP